MKQGQEGWITASRGTDVAFIIVGVVVLDGNKWHSAIPGRDVLLRCPSVLSPGQLPRRSDQALPADPLCLSSSPLSYFRRAALGTWT